jgi:hypothetical protein
MAVVIVGGKIIGSKTTMVVVLAPRTPDDDVAHRAAPRRGARRLPAADRQEARAKPRLMVSPPLDPNEETQKLVRRSCS